MTFKVRYLISNFKRSPTPGNKLTLLS